jgi:hypothetical protein
MTTLNHETFVKTLTQEFIRRLGQIDAQKINTNTTVEKIIVSHDALINQ